MDSKPVSLEDRDFITEKLSHLNTWLSEYSFSNLYLFRKKLASKLYRDGPFAVIQEKTYDNKEIWTPLEPITGDYKKFLKSLPGKPIIYPIPDEWVESFGPCQKQALSEDSDYLYTLHKMRHMEGRALDGQRNHIRQFESTYENAQIVDLNPARKEQAIAVLKEWQEDKKEETDYESCLEALNLLDVLGLEGRLVIIGDEPAGFILGRVRPELAIVQFMKAKKQFKGIYPFLFRDFALNVPDSVLWVNLGPDLGLPALRRAKKSYSPDVIALKWRISF